VFGASPWRWWNSKLFLQPNLFEYGIGGMPGFDLVVHGEVDTADGAVPDFMIPASLANEATASRTQNLFQTRGEISHINAAGSLRAVHCVTEKRSLPRLEWFD